MLRYDRSLRFCFLTFVSLVAVVGLLAFGPATAGGGLS